MAYYIIVLNPDIPGVDCEKSVISQFKCSNVVVTVGESLHGHCGNAVFMRKSETSLQ